MVDFKYKVTDIAKDFGISTKKVIETFAELTGETRKTGATFEENEVNALLEALTRETAVKDLGEYLASGKEPQPVKQETKKPEAKPQAKKEEPKPEAAKPQPKQPKQPKQALLRRLAALEPTLSRRARDLHAVRVAHVVVEHKPVAPRPQQRLLRALH